MSTIFGVEINDLCRILSKNIFIIKKFSLNYVKILRQYRTKLFDVLYAVLL